MCDAEAYARLAAKLTVLEQEVEVLRDHIHQVSLGESSMMTELHNIIKHQNVQLYELLTTMKAIYEIPAFPPREMAERVLRKHGLLDEYKPKSTEELRAEFLEVARSAPDPGTSVLAVPGEGEE